jgi:superoxide dismutase
MRPAFASGAKQAENPMTTNTERRDFIKRTLAGGRPVLVLDMYEHAYHMDYGAAAARYVDVYMEAIRWDNAAKLYEQYSREA